MSEYIDKIITESNRIAADAREKSDRLDEFKKELERLINKHCMDDFCKTPDYILADLLTENLITFEGAMKHRDKWYDS